MKAFATLNPKMLAFVLCDVMTNNSVPAAKIERAEILMNQGSGSSVIYYLLLTASSKPLLAWALIDLKMKPITVRSLTSTLFSAIINFINLR